MARAKPYIAQIMVSDKISIFDVDARLLQFSGALKECLVPDFDEYGLDLTQFFVTTIVKPDGERQYEYFKELHFRQFADVKDAEIRQQVGMIDQQTEAKRMIIESEALAGKRQIEGYDYRTERAYDVAEKVAQNEGTGEFASAGMGLGMMGGMGFGVGAVVADVTKDALGPIMGGASSPMAPLAGTPGAPAPPPLVDLRQEAQEPLPAAGSSLGAPAPSAADPDPGAPGQGGADAATSATAGPVCANCGVQLTPGAAFCMKCGSKAEALRADHCTGCGAELPEGSNFCPGCGAPTGQGKEGE
jgi:ribosomal protein L40E